MGCVQAGWGPKPWLLKLWRMSWTPSSADTTFEPARSVYHRSIRGQQLQQRGGRATDAAKILRGVGNIQRREQPPSRRDGPRCGF